MRDMISDMIQRAVKALPNSYSPYSHFQVGCCIQSGDVFFTGVNVENGAYPLTLCAETVAIGQMVASGHQQIDQMVVLSGEKSLCPPCGGCRQRIMEFATPNTLIHLCDHQSVLKTVTVDELLPLAFHFNQKSG